MRRSTLLGIILLVLVLLLVGGYTAFWMIAAGRMREGIAAWAQAERAQHLDVSWQKISVSGFPFAFRIQLETAELRDSALNPTPKLHLPALSGTARPWDFYDWQLAAAHGLTAELAGAGARPPVKLAAASATGAVSVNPRGGATFWLTLDQSSADLTDHVEASTTDCWLILPSHPPETHTDLDFSFAARVRQLRLPVGLPPFGDTVDDLAFGASVRGPIPGGALRQAATAWRDEGGTVELDNFRLDWGALSVSGTGTIALDQDLQPMGGFSGAIQGYDSIMPALVASGRMRPGDAGLARLALAMLAKAGPDGRPEVTTSFTIQNGQMFLGPAKLGPAPRIAWE